jgi:hypothetical protein
MVMLLVVIVPRTAIVTVERPAAIALPMATAQRVLLMVIRVPLVVTDPRMATARTVTRLLVVIVLLTVISRHAPPTAIAHSDRVRPRTHVSELAVSVRNAFVAVSSKRR